MRTPTAQTATERLLADGWVRVADPRTSLTGYKERSTNGVRISRDEQDPDSSWESWDVTTISGVEIRLRTVTYFDAAHQLQRDWFALDTVAERHAKEIHQMNARDARLQNLSANGTKSPAFINAGSSEDSSYAAIAMFVGVSEDAVYAADPRAEADLMGVLDVVTILGLLGASGINYALRKLNPSVFNAVLPEPHLQLIYPGHGQLCRWVLCIDGKVIDPALDDTRIIAETVLVLAVVGCTSDAKPKKIAPPVPAAVPKKDDDPMGHPPSAKKVNPAAEKKVAQAAPAKKATAAASKPAPTSKTKKEPFPPKPGAAAKAAPAKKAKK